MAIPWLVVLKNVPWAEVIKTAPKVAEGAKKLWSSVNGSPAAQELAAEAEATVDLEQPTTAAMQTRIATLETAVNELHGQMLASSELIKTLADQNTQLIERIERERVRGAWLAWIALASGVVALAAMAVVFLR